MDRRTHDAPPASKDGKGNRVISLAPPTLAHPLDDREDRQHGQQMQQQPVILHPTTVRPARLVDLPYIEHLRLRFTRELGFIPKIALENRIAGRRGGIVSLAMENGDPCGFLHTGSLRREECRIFQAAIQYDAQRRHHGEALVGAFVRTARVAGVKLVTLRCLSDLESNDFWQSMGFVEAGRERVGGQKNRGAQLIVWARRLMTPTDLLDPHFRPPLIPERTRRCRGCGRLCTYSRGPKGELSTLCNRCHAGNGIPARRLSDGESALFSNHVVNSSV